MPYIQKKVKRLQGKAFHDVKHLYKMTGFIISSNGNIDAYLCLKSDPTVTIHHWLSEQEKNRFLASSYYAKSEVIGRQGNADFYSCVKQNPIVNQMDLLKKPLRDREKGGR